MKIKFISIFVVLLIFNMPLLVSAQQVVSEVEQARADAERDAEKYVSSLAWNAVGFGCGCFGLAYAYLATPTAPVGVLLGKTPHICCHVYPSLPRERETATDAVRCYRLCCKQSSEHGSPFVVSFRDELMLSSSKPT